MWIGWTRRCDCRAASLLSIRSAFSQLDGQPVWPSLITVAAAELLRCSVHHRHRYGHSAAVMLMSSTPRSLIADREDRAFDRTHPLTAASRRSGIDWLTIRRGSISIDRSRSRIRRTASYWSVEAERLQCTTAGPQNAGLLGSET